MEPGTPTGSWPLYEKYLFINFLLFIALTIPLMVADAMFIMHLKHRYTPAWESLGQAGVHLELQNHENDPWLRQAWRSPHSGRRVHQEAHGHAEDPRSPSEHPVRVLCCYICSDAICEIDGDLSTHDQE